MMALRWCQGAATVQRKRGLFRGLLLFALFSGPYSYAQSATGPSKSDTFEETPQKPATRAPSVFRSYSASAASVGESVTQVDESEGGDSRVRVITVGGGRAGVTFSLEAVEGKRVYGVRRSAAEPSAAAPAASLSPFELLAWLQLSYLARMGVAGPSLRGHIFAPSQARARVATERPGVEPEPPAWAPCGLWAW